MATLHRSIVKVISKALDVNIVRDRGIGLLFEKAHLKRFLAYFNVDCVFDIGANEGQYAQQLRDLGYRGAIVSFEPIPELAENLRLNAAYDPLWFIEEVALDDAVRNVSFNIMVQSQFSSLKAPSHTETQRFVKDNAVARSFSLTTGTLSTFFDTYRKRLGFIRPYLKMDTQGNDIAVARGAAECLSEFVGLQSELAIKKLYEGQADYRDALTFYSQMGFELSALVPNNEGHFPRLFEIDCIMMNTRMTKGRE
jgi:FkbM family methyltransferase